MYKNNKQDNTSLLYGLIDVINMATNSWMGAVYTTLGTKFMDLILLQTDFITDFDNGDFQIIDNWSNFDRCVFKKYKYTEM